MMKDVQEILSKVFINPNYIRVIIAPPRVRSHGTDSNRSRPFLIDCVEQFVQRCLTKPFWGEGELVNYYEPRPFL
jgi:hypothetical protein